MAVLIAAVLVFAFSISAFGATITVNNTIKDETYKLYKMLDLETNGDNTAFKYTVNDAWKDFFTGQGAGGSICGD